MWLPANEQPNPGQVLRDLHSQRGRGWVAVDGRDDVGVTARRHGFDDDGVHASLERVVRGALEAAVCAGDDLSLRRQASDV